MRLEGKVALVTDAASESGKAAARRLAQEGAILVLNTYGSELGYEIDAELVSADPTSQNEVDALLDDIVRNYGRIDVLVHNNNDIVRASIEECSDEVFDHALRVNAKTAFLFTQAAGRKMKEKRSGKIIYISSVHGEKPSGSSFAYSMAKGAVKMLARESALDLGLYNVNVNLIEVGPVEGDEERFASDVSFLYENLNYKIPNRALGTMDEVSNLVLFLASEESRFINGADIRIDGGFLLSYMTRPNYEEAVNES